MIRDLINFDSYRWTNWGVIGLSLLAFLFVAPVVTQAQDMEQQVETNRQLINSLYDQLDEEELKFYGFISSSYKSNQGVVDNGSPSVQNKVNDRSAFQAGKLGLFIEQSISDKVRIAGELFLQNGILVQEDPSLLANGQIEDGLFESSYYFIEYQDSTLGTIKAGKNWKPFGLRNEIGNNSPALKTIGLSHFYGQPGTLTYGFRSGAGLFYERNLDFLDNPLFSTTIDLFMVNGRDDNRYSEDTNSFKDHGGRLTLTAANPSSLGLDSLQFAFSTQFGKPKIIGDSVPFAPQNFPGSEVTAADGESAEDEIYYYSFKGSSGPFSFILEYEDLRQFGLWDPENPPRLTASEISGTIAYGDLLYQVLPSTTLYYRAQEWDLTTNNYWDNIVGVSHELQGMTLKGQVQQRDWDNDAANEDYTQFTAEAVVPF